MVQKTRNYGEVCQMGGFNPVGAPNTVYYPLGLVTTPQNMFRTMLRQNRDSRRPETRDCGLCVDDVFAVGAKEMPPPATYK